MAKIIQELFINPPIAVARLGGSTVPQDAYRWIESPDPRTGGDTVVTADWSLAVQADGSVRPHMPEELHFRDGALIRPVAPFLELWARVGEPGSAAGTWRDVPLTPKLLATQGVNLADLSIRVNAINGKAARRTGNAALRFGTFPPVEVRGDDNRSVPLLATSPPGVTRPMIPGSKKIPLGSVQVIRSRPQPTSADVPWRDVVNVEQLRIRFTPARGHVYGPPQSGQLNRTPNRQRIAPVDLTRAFLDPRAGWAGARFDAPDDPGDTYDGADVTNNPDLDPSLGVVDDTCEARIEVSFRLPQQGGKTLTAAANIFVAPPDFAPDRRPFLSLADELNDRTADAAARNATLSAADLDVWVEDLFERIRETVALLNVDLQRNRIATTLADNQLTALIPKDKTPRPKDAMGGRDPLRNRDFWVSAPNTPNPLPLTKHARMRHLAMSDLQGLRDLVRLKPGRLKELIREPFEVRPGERMSQGNVLTTMAMPPFMRNSNGLGLSLSSWQYELLMKWVADTLAGGGAATGAVANVVPASALVSKATSPDAAMQSFTTRATARRQQVLARVLAGRPKP